MAESEFSLLPGLPDTGDSEAVWWVRFTEETVDPSDHPIALYVSDSGAGLLANQSGEALIIEDGAQYVTTTGQKYAYSVEVENRVVPMRTGWVTRDETSAQSGVLNRKVSEIPEQLCGVTLPPKQWAWPPVEVDEELEKPEYQLIENRISEHFEAGEIVTDRDIKRDVYDARRFGNDSADEWWEQIGMQYFSDSELVEKCDSTGRRWRVSGEME